MIAVGAIDDDAMLLEGLGAWMGRDSTLSLVATARDVNEFLALAPEVDVVILDLNLRDGTSVSTNVKRLIAAGHKVLVVSTVPDKEYVIEALEAGAAGYITKDRDLDTLARSLQDVADGTGTVTPQMAFLLSADRRLRRPQLSPRERDVLWHYGRGMTLDSVARKLGIRPGTAREYLARVKQKYQEVDRPAYTKSDLAERMREDRMELNGLE
ncbi:response regulator transcription factor [Demequina sp.]|uniref:response regulator n=1 Tax=Demequina sp. TaxID=2050685 RepID=UPI0025BDFE06|nr:response regulator transcription factor [Demequina sp.]